MDSAYKIYANILNERLMVEVDNKLEEGQFGFRKGRGVMDAVYVLNHITDREVGKRKGKVFACFTGLKAAFNRVDRKIMKERMKKIGINTRLRERIMDTYKETKNAVKIAERITGRGVLDKERSTTRMSYESDAIQHLRSRFRKRNEERADGGVTVAGRKIWTITYADDIVLLAEREEELKGMLKRFGKFLEKGKLILSPEKIKVMVFEKGRGRARKRK